MIEQGKRYRKVTSYVEDPKGKYLAKTGPGGKIGLLDLSVKTQFGYPIDPATGKSYLDAGFAADVIEGV